MPDQVFCYISQCGEKVFAWKCILFFPPKKEIINWDRETKKPARPLRSSIICDFCSTACFTEYQAPGIKLGNRNSYY